MYQLGNADMKDEPTPFHVTSDDLGDATVISVGAGGQHTVLLAAETAAFNKWVASPPAMPAPTGATSGDGAAAGTPARGKRRGGGAAAKQARAGKRSRR